MGFFRDSSGSVVGETGSGRWGDTHGSCEGTYRGGTIMQYGRIVGTVDDDGNVYDRYGNLTDYTHEDD